MAIPLDGVRVLDLSTQIAGPYATKLLADAGADVVKIETPGGDLLRHWKASAQLGDSEPLAEDEDGVLFGFLNAGKRSVVLELESAAGRDALLDLAASADLIVESFVPGRMDELGLSVAALRAANPKLSLLRVTPFGQDGPWARRPATGVHPTGRDGLHGLPRLCGSTARGGRRPHRRIRVRHLRGSRRACRAARGPRLGSG